MTIKNKRTSTAGAVPASLESGQFAINDADGIFFWRDSTGAVRSFPLSASSGGVPAQNVQIFDGTTALTTRTWPKPTGAKKVWVGMQAPGGGGASGGRVSASGTPARGGCPGGPGGYIWAEFNADDLPVAVDITIGAPGVGGASRTSGDVAGVSGTNGGAIAFGPFSSGTIAGNNPFPSEAYSMVVYGGQGGTATVSGAPGAGRITGPTGAASNATANTGTAESDVLYCSLPGGAGGTLNQNVTTLSANGNAGYYSTILSRGTDVLGAPAVASAKTNPVAPIAAFAVEWGLLGAGGPGGWANADGTAGPGADAFRGGGGGGGGGARGASSGKGGIGGKGRVVVVTSF